MISEKANGLRSQTMFLLDVEIILLSNIKK